MILWTIFPVEIVLNGIERPPELAEVDYAGKKILVEKVTDAQYRIIRLLTTNPQDYLRPDLQPGSILTYQPFVEALTI